MSYEVLVQLLLETRCACLLGLVLFIKICRCDTILQDDVGPVSGLLVGFCAVCKNRRRRIGQVFAWQVAQGTVCVGYGRNV